MSGHRKHHSDFPAQPPLLQSGTLSRRSTGLAPHCDLPLRAGRVDCPETAGPDSRQVVASAYKLVGHYFRDEEPGYCARTRKYLVGEWQAHRRNLDEHLNKMGYLELEMRKRNYAEVELQIVVEWRKCKLLYLLRALWYEYVLGLDFASIGSFMAKYDRFKEFVGQLAYYYFKGFFPAAKGYSQPGQLLDKLTQRTTHMIITHTATWSKICSGIFTPLVKNKMAVSGNLCYDTSGLTLEGLDIKSVYLGVEDEQSQFKGTIAAIGQFTGEHKVLEKIKLLIDVRKALEADILKKQQKMTSNQQPVRIIEKDDLIDCLVYCIINGGILLSEVGASIKYFHLLLGTDAGSLLSKFRCDCYLTDLEAAFEYLLMKVSEHSDQQQQCTA